MSTEIGFYHLTRSEPDQALPALLDRTLKSGQRALVLTTDTTRLATLDNALWTCPDPDWLPHGTETAPNAPLQPILLALANPNSPIPPPNEAKFLFLLDGAALNEYAHFTRVFDLFDGKDPEAVANARTRWTTAKAAGHTLVYWQQGERGWERKSAS